MTKHICVINWKGGCGKTTIATHLAVALASSGLETGLADYDRQKTAKLWKKLRPKGAAPCGWSTGAKVSASVPRLCSAWSSIVRPLSEPSACVTSSLKAKLRLGRIIALIGVREAIT